ncbi:MAG: hypothetical protein U0793_31035 [Gemmataceae bacterium]
MSPAGEVIIELFGVPRHKAGAAEVRVPAGTLEQVLRGVERLCPALGEVCVKGRLASHYLLALDGQSFVADLQRPMAPGTRLVLLSADVGG